MTPEDRALARNAILRNLLTIEQVTEIQKEVDATGRSFAQVAVARGLLKPDQAAPAPEAPAVPVPPIFQKLLVATLGLLVLLVVIGVLQYRRRNARDQQLAEESMRAIADADQRAKKAAIDYSRRQLDQREQELQAALAKARELMKFAEERFRNAPAEPQLHLQLVEATLQFNAYLAGHEDDAAVLIERCRAYELRRDFEHALKDLDRAIELKKELAPQLDARLQELRLQVARPKK